MARLLIVYHTRTGGSRQMALAAADGAGDECEVIAQRAAETTQDDMLAAQGFIFCGPENLGALSGEMKECLDRLYYALLGRIEARAYAHLICAGSDGQGAARQLARIVTGWRLRAIQEPLVIITGAQTAEAIAQAKDLAGEDLEKCRDVGQAMGAGLSMGIF